MARQGIRRIATLIVLAIATEILIGAVVEAHPKQNDQPNKDKKKEASASPPRIAGGSLTTIKDFPTQVAIFYDGIFVCGGTLVGRKLQHVLTAARCLLTANGKIRETNMLHVVLQSSNVPVFESSAVVRRLRKVLIHPDFKPMVNRDNDIAILTFDTPLFSRMQPTRLESAADFTGKDYKGKTGVTVGWGVTTLWQADQIKPEVNEKSKQLKKVDMPILSRDSCVALLKERYPTDKEDMTYAGRAICAQAKAKEGPCKDDTGGPLFVDGIQVGITTTISGCGDNRYPVMFTRVASYRDWINKELIN